MNKLILCLLIVPITLFGWTQLAFALGGCLGLPPPPDEGEDGGEGEGEGEGEGTPGAAGGVTFSDTTFEGDHEVGVTTCPQNLGVLTLANESGEVRSVVFGQSFYFQIASEAGGLLTSVELAVDESVDVTAQFNCGQASDIGDTIGAEVRDSTGVTLYGTVLLQTSVDVL